MKCPIKGCKTIGTFDTDTKMYQHVNTMHRGEQYTPNYPDEEPKKMEDNQDKPVRQAKWKSKDL